MSDQIYESSSILILVCQAFSQNIVLHRIGTLEFSYLPYKLHSLLTSVCYVTREPLCLQHLRTPRIQHHSHCFPKILKRFIKDAFTLIRHRLNDLVFYYYNLTSPPH
ncbi:uncharacterized protein LOC118767173 [Octopus sinensis]|uniref:Uncharacterized protein LOC118767173 n=1 Tax=Octopus sinensis TaxID=2607531 RepID=A0A7E6FHJ6_9MOLL|nr:uncharacterized protein LOC118767173 [Octopus sinensis]